MCLTKINRIQKLRAEKLILNLFKEKGIPRSQVEEIKWEFADRKPKEGEEYYYLSGPMDEKTRSWCKKLLQLDKVVSKLDIDILSNYMGYNVFEYEPGPIMPNGGPGGPNCRHKWVRFRGKRILTPELTVRQIKDLANRSVFK